jgi:hypothetical protein
MLPRATASPADAAGRGVDQPHAGE